MVKGVFRDSILAAGEFLTSSHRLFSKNLLHLLVSDKRFEKYKDEGLVDDLLSYEEESKNRIFEIPQTVSWERIIMKQPDILNDIRDAVVKETAFFTRTR